MHPKDILLITCVIIAWGINFVIIKLGVDDIPPLLLAALRFMLVAFPAVFFVPRPKVALRWILAYGLSICFGQFALLFLAIKLGMPAGLASLLLQSQAFFTALLGAVVLSEKLHWNHLLGLFIAFAGVALLANGDLGSTHLPLIGLILTLLAACCWGTGNICNRIIMRNGSVQTMSLVVWSGLVPIVPLSVCSWIFEGPVAISQSLHNFHLRDLGVVVYLALISTHLGYGVWGYLLGRYEASKIAPLTLLVPVVGLVAAWGFLGEELTGQEWIGAVVIALGLLMTIFGRQLVRHLRQRHLTQYAD